MEDSKKNYIIIIGIILFILIVTAGSLVFFKIQTAKMTKGINDGEIEEYDKYYVMIVKEKTSEFWKTVYEGAKIEGQNNSIYVELLGTNLSAEYSRDELMEIAIRSKVDGIIVEADESLKMTELINEAAEQEIPVVTVLGDNTAALRKSFIGVGSYNLGREYGRQVIELRENESKDALILLSGSADGPSQNVLLSGIQETIDNEMSEEGKALIDIKIVDDESTFSAEESIRDIFINSEQLPDIMICLDEQSAACVYQAVVDYNKVGEISIIGYYDSPTILRAIERKVVHSTISIDAEQMGRFCVEALNEYNETGYVSEYFSVDVTVINSENVMDYIGGDNNNEQY